MPWGKTAKHCESCLMPLDKAHGQEVREHQNYCNLCFRDGKFCYEGDWEGFRQAAYDSMVSRGMNKYKAKFFAWLTRFAPRWKNSY